MLDLFGPYPIRGKVQKRVTSKGYGVIVTDLISAHIEGVFGYDTKTSRWHYLDSPTFGADHQKCFRTAEHRLWQPVMG